MSEIRVPDQQVAIVACKNKEFLSGIDKLAKQDGIEVVLSSPQVIDDYIKARISSTEDPAERMKAFLADENSRKLANAHAVELYRILNGKEFSVYNNDSDTTYELKVLVKNTSLSWRKANDILDTLESFGLVRRIDKMHFMFTIDPIVMRESVLSDVIESLEVLVYHLSRYRGIIKCSVDIDDEERQRMTDELDNRIKNLLK